MRSRVQRPRSLLDCRSAVDLMGLVGVQPPSRASAAFLRAASAAPASAADRAAWGVISPAPWPARAPKTIVRCSGRASFKTTDGAWIGAWQALCVDHDRHALPGSRIYCALVAPGKKQAAEGVRMVRAVLDALAPVGVRYSVRDVRGESTEVTIEAPRTSCTRVITVFACDVATPRGYAYCFLHMLEAGHMPTGPGLATTDRGVLQAIAPRLAQFPRAQLYAESTPGPPEGTFFDWVTKPPAGALLVRGSTFDFNPNVSEHDARAWCPDPRVYRQEILADAWGMAGESFLDPDAVDACEDAAGSRTRLGPRPCHAALGVDLAQLRDGRAFVVVTTRDEELAPGRAPIKHYVVEAIEAARGSRSAPLMLDDEARRALSVARRFPSPDGVPCGMTFDKHLAVEFASKARSLGGYGQTNDVRSVGPGRLYEAPMHVAAQTARWRHLREVVNGGRLHVPATPLGRELLGQLQSLAAWEVSGGLKVEGSRKADDLADALVLAIEVAQHLPASGGSGRVEFRYEGLHRDEEGVRVRGARYVRVHDDGREEMTGVPPWAPEAEQIYRDWAAQGIHTSESIEFFRQREQQGEAPSLSAPVMHDDAAPLRRMAPSWGNWAFGRSDSR